jgi:hypothetical protein
MDGRKVICGRLRKWNVGSEGDKVRNGEDIDEAG